MNKSINLFVLTLNLLAAGITFRWYVTGYHPTDHQRWIVAGLCFFSALTVLITIFKKKGRPS